MKYKSARLTNAAGKMWHIGIDESEAGKHFILPGDPARCPLVAKEFDNTFSINHNTNGSRCWDIYIHK